MDRQLRFMLQSQMPQSNKRVVQVEAGIPGGNGIYMSGHFVARGPVIVKNRSNHPNRYYDPSTHGEAAFTIRPAKQEVVEAKPVVNEDEEFGNLNGFQVTKVENKNPFADLGIIEVDDTVISEEERTPGEEEESLDMSREDILDLLEAKTAKKFGIEKPELAGLKLTTGEVKKLFQAVVGKSTNNLTVGKMKRRIRDNAATSYANYVRVLTALRTTLNIESKEG